MEIKNLRVDFPLREGTVTAVDGVDLQIKKRTVLGVVGESGSGKTVTAHSILRIIPKPGEIVSGEINFYDEDVESPINLATLDRYGNLMRAIRGKKIGMIFQEPMTALSPVYTIGNQIIEAIRIHDRNIRKAEAAERAIAVLDQVGVPNPKSRLNSYPFQLSGGLRQRAMIAMALSCQPSLLIADEPTTAIDVTVQAQILDLLQSLQRQMQMAIMFITHDLGVISQIADEVAVMYLGKVVERGRTKTVFTNPVHPYTEALLSSLPRSYKHQDQLTTIRGSVPSPYDRPRGCGFAPRCDQAIDACSKIAPTPVEVSPGHWVSCLRRTEQSGLEGMADAK